MFLSQFFDSSRFFLPGEACWCNMVRIGIGLLQIVGWSNEETCSPPISANSHSGLRFWLCLRVYARTGP